MIGSQLSRVRSRATACEICMERQAHARLGLQRQRQRFFGNPLNLLLPFTVGALLAARLRARPARGTRKARGTSFGSMLRTGINLWAATEGLRSTMTTKTSGTATRGLSDTNADATGHREV